MRNRQPQGTLATFSFSGADVFDSTDTMDVFFSIPDRASPLIEATCWVMFREFFASSKSLASSGTLTSDSGGGATTVSGGGASSGSNAAASSSSTTGSEGLFLNFTGPDAVHNHGGAVANDGGHSHLTAISDHSHGMTHTHSHSHTTPAHTHATPDHDHTVAGHSHSIVYGVFKEAYPVSHSVTIEVSNYESAWILRGTFPGLTDDVVELDLKPYVFAHGYLWRLRIKSDAAQPNGGRLGCDVAGHVIAGIQSA